jgi:RNA polymerase sigma factor (sigma-70 family)
MKLTEEQANKVSENHNLIYWIINLKNLDIDEWYDLLALELCYTIMKHDADRGSLSNYYKMRAEGMISKEYRKQQSQKRAHTDIQYIENLHSIPDPTRFEQELEVNEWIDIKDSTILRMKHDGYSQVEIAETMGVSQSYISKLLKKLRTDYDEFAN